MSTGQKAAFYIRVSTEEQAEEGQSPSAQEEVLRQYCNMYGIEVYKVYRDLGYSGKGISDRPGLSSLLEDCRLGCFSLVLVWKISRLSRNLKDLLYLIDCFEAEAVHFTSCSEKFDTSTPIGRMTLQLLGSIAEFERNTIVENVKLGLAEFARQGGKSTTVLGYDNKDKELVPNENEAGLVRLIFSLFVEAGFSCRAIAQHLNSMGFRTKRGNAFRGSSVAYILHNPVYIGINRHGLNTDSPYSVKGQQPAIITRELWNKAQALLSERSRSTSPKRQQHPGLLKIICSKCGRHMKVFYTKARGRKYKYYRCCCSSGYVNASRLTEAIRLAIRSALEDGSLQQGFHKLPVLRSDDGSRLITEAYAVDNEINRLRKSMERYLRLFEDYKLSDEGVLLERLSEIKHRIKQLEEKRLELHRAESAPELTDSDINLENQCKKLLTCDDADMEKLASSLVRSVVACKECINVVLYK